MAATTAAVVGGVASAASAANSISQSGSGGAPKWQTRQQRNLTTQSNNVNQQTAGFTPDQIQAQQQIRDMQGRYDPALAGAQARAEQLANGVGAEQIRSFYNPFENDAVSAYLADLQQMRGQQDVAVSDAARAAGAFGGDREAVYRASIQGQLDRNGAGTLSNMRMAGYNNAVQAAMQNAGVQQSGNAQLANLIGQRMGAGYSDAAMLGASGAQQQGLTQQQLDERMNTLRFRSEINNPGTSYQRPPSQQGDPIAAALHGFQGGFQGVQGAMDYWRNMQGLNNSWATASQNFSNAASNLPTNIIFPE